MTRNFHHPLSRRKQSKNHADIDGPPRKYNAVENGAPNVIDGDGTEISANDSVVAMARRMDASRAIEDPSFIVGTSPHFRGVDPGGSGGLTNGKGGGRDGGPRGLYAHDRGWGSTVAGERERLGNSSDGGSSSSDSSMERNPLRGERGRPAGRPRERFRGSSRPDNKDHARSRGGGGKLSNPGLYFPDPDPPELNANRGRQWQYNSSASRGRQKCKGSAPSERNPSISGPPESNASRRVKFAERGRRRASDPGPPEVNAKVGDVRFAERGWRRSLDPEPPEPNTNRGVRFAEKGRRRASDPGPPELNMTREVKFPKRGRRRASDPEPPELNAKREVRLAERGRRRASDPKPPELNAKRSVRFAERVQRRVYNPHHREGFDPPTLPSAPSWPRERIPHGSAGPNPARQRGKRECARETRTDPAGVGTGDVPAPAGRKIPFESLARPRKGGSRPLVVDAMRRGASENSIPAPRMPHAARMSPEKARSSTLGGIIATKKNGNAPHGTPVAISPMKTLARIVNKVSKGKDDDNKPSAATNEPPSAAAPGEPPATDRMPKKTPSGGIVATKKENAPNRMSPVAVGQGRNKKASTGSASLLSPPPKPSATAMLALLNVYTRSYDRAPSRSSRPKGWVCPLARCRAWCKIKEPRLEEEPQRQGAKAAESLTTNNQQRPTNHEHECERHHPA